MATRTPTTSYNNHKKYSKQVKEVEIVEVEEVEVVVSHITEELHEDCEARIYSSQACTTTAALAKMQWSLS